MAVWILKSQDFLSVVDSCWHKRVHGYNMMAVWNKLKNVKEGLKQLTKQDFNAVEDRVLNARSVLLSMQEQMRDHQRHHEQAQNCIRKLVTRDGVLLHSEMDIEQEVVEFYKELLLTNFQ
ncbi:hypothetical protein K7X08_028221 [Anisodus acutangulus]|uniref:Uncharacterized protein n=1 Tax=Anisodus acutangulus TaxID=402998 RepID=A0A9Q1MUP8_9SOLA|nr:hypothetical protein K7X08_028221 [Anisodus acutangulus]